VRFDVAEAAELLEAARAALARYREDRPPSAPAELALEGGDFDAWRLAVQNLVNGGAYRGKTIPADSFVRVVESPAAPAVLRVGSALALSRADATTKARVRVAIDDTADAELAEQMRAALEGEVSARKLARLEK